MRSILNQQYQSTEGRLQMDTYNNRLIRWTALQFITGRNWFNCNKGALVNVEIYYKTSIANIQSDDTNCL